MGLHWLIIILNVNHVYCILTIVKIVIISQNVKHVFKIIILIVIINVKCVNKAVNLVILQVIVKYVSDSMYYKLISHVNYVRNLLLDVNNVCIIQQLNV